MSLRAERSNLETQRFESRDCRVATIFAMTAWFLLRHLQVNRPVELVDLGRVDDVAHKCEFVLGVAGILSDPCDEPGGPQVEVRVPRRGRLQNEERPDEMGAGRRLSVVALAEPERHGRGLEAVSGREPVCDFGGAALEAGITVRRAQLDGGPHGGNHKRVSRM